MNFETINGAVIHRPGVIHATISRSELMKRAEAALLCLEHFMEGLQRTEEAASPARKNYTPTDKGHRKVEGIVCPQCGDEMRQRTSIYGDFYGCINYPTCQGKRQLDGHAPVPKR